MSEYTPTTESVRWNYAVYWQVEDHDTDGSAEAREAAFDRWLAAHDAEVLRAAATELEQSIHHLDPSHPSELSFINCTRIDARELRDRADRIERGER